jgi:hypothetical protein
VSINHRLVGLVGVFSAPPGALVGGLSVVVYGLGYGLVLGLYWAFSRLRRAR